MISYELGVDIFFRLFNFGLLLGLGWYAFNQYGRPYLNQLMAEYVRTRESRKHELQSLTKQYAQLQLHVDGQVKLYDQLKKNITLWVNAIDGERIRVECEYQDRMIHLRRVNILRSEYVAMHKMRLSVLPDAVQVAQEKLSEHYQKGQAGKILLQSLIVQMQESSR